MSSPDIGRFMAPRDIAMRRFQRVPEGYRPEEVEWFLAEVAAQTRHLIEELAALRSQMEQPAGEALPVEDSAYRRLADEFSATIRAVDAAAAGIRRESEREARAIQTAAKEDAERIRTVARADAERIRTVARADAERLFAAAREKAERSMEAVRREAVRTLRQARADAAEVRAFGSLRRRRGPHRAPPEQPRLQEPPGAGSTRRSAPDIWLGNGHGGPPDPDADSLDPGKKLDRGSPLFDLWGDSEPEAGS